MLRLFTILSLGLAFSACNTFHKPPDATFNERMLEQQQARVDAGQDPYQEAVGPATADPVQASLWAKSVGGIPSLIRNQKAQKIGDLLTILINEDAKASTTAKTDAKRENKVDITGTAAWGQGVSDTTGGLTLGTSNKNEFKGQGQTDKSGKFIATVQAVVENVLPNGSLYIRGHKAITINNEEQEVEISGFVRPDDIRINNTVVSSLLADAKVRYIGNGVVSDKQHTGWGTRLLDAIWPF